jgi:hypothetical protein
MEHPWVASLQCQFSVFRWVGKMSAKEGENIKKRKPVQTCPWSSSRLFIFSGFSLSVIVSLPSPANSDVIYTTGLSVLQRRTFYPQEGLRSTGHLLKLVPHFTATGQFWLQRELLFKFYCSCTGNHQCYQLQSIRPSFQLNNWLFRTVSKSQTSKRNNGFFF